MRLSTTTTAIAIAYAASAVAAPVINYHPTPPAPLQSVLSKWDKDPRSRYPTDLTRDITPKPIHSHNDYWRTTPLITGLSVGAISTEADVWFYNSTLLVGHHPSALTENRTFASLYIEPLVEILTAQNPDSPYLPGMQTRWGVFDAAPDQSLFLWVDIKTAANETFEAVVEALEPLREKGWLTEHDGTNLRRGPVTVVGTGSTPKALVESMNPRYIFLDAPLGKLNEPGNQDITNKISLMASTNLKSVVGEVRGNELSDAQLGLVRAQIEEAREKGLGARYWNTPAWPGTRRRGVWRQLVEEGVALVSVDEVEEAAYEL